MYLTISSRREPNSFNSTRRQHYPEVALKKKSTPGLFFQSRCPLVFTSLNKFNFIAFFKICAAIVGPCLRCPPKDRSNGPVYERVSDALTIRFVRLNSHVNGYGCQRGNDDTFILGSCTRASSYVASVRFVHLHIIKPCSCCRQLFFEVTYASFQNFHRLARNRGSQLCETFSGRFLVNMKIW